MIRDFTDARKSILKGQIDEVNSETFCWLTDKAGDLTMKFAHWIGIMDIRKSLDNIGAYHKRVLDMNDMTKKEIDEIFAEVEKVDASYKKKFTELTDFLEEWTGKSKILTDQISPSFAIASAAEMKKACKQVNKKMENLNGEITETFGDVLSYREKRVAMKAAKELVGGTLGAVISVVAMPATLTKAFVTGGPAGLVKECTKQTWGLCNDVFSIGQDAVGFVGIGLGLGIGALSGKNKNRVRAQAIEQASEISGRDGLTGEFESLSHGDDIFSKFYGKAAKVSGALDTLDTIDDVWSGAKDIKDFGKDVKENGLLKTIISETGFTADLTPDKLKSADKSLKGKKLKQLNKIYQEYGKKKNFLSNIKTGYDYVEGFFSSDSSVQEKVVKNTTGGGLLSDLADLWNAGEEAMDQFVIRVY